MTVVWALTWLGQSAALAVLTAACVRLPACSRSAKARHAAWGATLAICAGLLVVPFVPGADAPASRVVPGAAGLQAAAANPLVVLPAAVTGLSGWFGWTWVLGAAAGLALAARDAWRVVSLKRRTEPLSFEERARFGAVLSTAASRTPSVGWCDELDSPSLLGFFRPVVALPRAQAASLSDAQCQLVVLHELAHVRRRDDWWALAERVLLAVAWVNPAVHWARRERVLAREMACDEWVVRHTAAPVAYAACLTEVAALRTRARRLPLAANATGKPGALRRRIVGVLALDGRYSAGAGAVAAWLAPVAVVVVAAGMLRLPPVAGIAGPTDLAVPGAFRSGLAEAAPPVIGEQPAGRPRAAVLTVAEPRDRPPRGSSVARPMPAVPVGTVVGVSTERAVEPGPAFGTPPLAAVPVPGAGEPGVTDAEFVAATFPIQSGSEPWWSEPAAGVHAAGGAAAAGARAAASYFAGLGSRVPQLFNR